jgi:two-component system response regulator NreC
MIDESQIIRVIIVDDHTLFRMGMVAIFHTNHPDIRIVAEAEDGKKLFTLLPFTPVDIVLLDINLPDMNGVDIAHRLRREYSAVKILAISAENDSATIEAMINAGIDGFISKQNSKAEELSEAIRTVMRGLEYFGRDISSIIFGVYLSKKKTAAVSNEFTGRERDIINLSREGLLCKEIAERLDISINTVNTHKKRIFQKLGINTTLEMVQYALKKGIIKISD